MRLIDADALKKDLTRFYDNEVTAKRLIDEQPTIEPKPHWIKCSKRLPNNHEYIKNNGLFNVSDGNRSYSEWFDIYDTQRFGEPTITGFRVDYAVIAWMELPAPYEPLECEDTMKSLSQNIIEHAKRLYPKALSYKGQLTNKQFCEIEKECDIDFYKLGSQDTRYTIRYKAESEDKK